MRFTVLATLPVGSLACTTVVVAPGATKDGGSMVLDLNDCFDCDFRAAAVRPLPAHEPARVLQYHEQYPRELSGRSPTYQTDNLDMAMQQSLRDTWASSEWLDNRTAGWLAPSDFAGATTGLRSQSGESTFAGIEALYGIVNEQQVAMAESTCGARSGLWSPKRNLTSGYGALWEISSMSKAALARCPTALCAVEFMGAIAERDGYYGGDTPESESGESLLIIDPEDAWVFQVAPWPPIGSDPSEPFSAVWAAQRVPHGHIAVVPNTFTIRNVTEGATESFRYSKNIFGAADRLTRASAPTTSAQVVDFAGVFGDVEDMGMKAYSTDRWWRVLDLLAVPPSEAGWPWPPSSPNADEYPFSAPVSRPLDYSDMLRVGRDYYEGAKHPELDLTTGLLAGPFGDPTRSPGPKAMTLQVLETAGDRRAISVPFTNFAYVAEVGRGGGARNESYWRSRVWFGQGATHSAVFAPLHVAAAVAGKALPRSLTTGSLQRSDVFDGKPEETSGYWRTSLVTHWIRAAGFDLAVGTVRGAQGRVESQAAADADRAEAVALAHAAAGGETAAVETLAAQDQITASGAAVSWQDLITELMTRFHDHYVVTAGIPVVSVRSTPYPKWFLDLSLQAAVHGSTQVAELAESAEASSAVWLGCFTGLALVLGLVAGRASAKVTGPSGAVYRDALDRRLLEVN